MMTCSQCGQEIVGAWVCREFDPRLYAYRWTTVPEVIERHNSLCSLVYPWQGVAP